MADIEALCGAHFAEFGPRQYRQPGVAFHEPILITFLWV